MAKEENKPERILVTAALPYANGPLHIGHAIGAYIPADVYTRYHRLKGNDVIYICGTDEHGTPIVVAAGQEKITPKDVVDKYHGIIKGAFSDLGISFDNFSRTTKKLHHKTSGEFFLEILNKGFIYTKVVKRPYCPGCERFLPDRYVKGTCPYCGSENERGDQCEVCGKQLEPHELKDAYCAICHGTPKEKETKHWFFKLSEFSDKLKTWIGDQNKHWPDNARNFSLGWIGEGLKDRAITRDLSWGVPVPVEGGDGKVLYVWFDAPIGYISATKEWAKNIGKPELWKDYWLSGGQRECKIVHFLGKDNIPFHAIIWPAMLMAHSGYNLPWQIASNEYLTLEGQKMSTSRGWVVWLHEVLAEFEPDALRYYLLSINPEKSDSDFDFKKFQQKVNSELIGTLGNFINRTLAFIQNKNEGIVPKYDVGKKTLDLIMKEDGILPEIKKIPHPNDCGISPDILGIMSCSSNYVGPMIEAVGQTINGFALKMALSDLLRIAQAGNTFFQKNEPWKNANGTTLFLCANLCRSLAILMYPFLPFSAERVWKMLGLQGSVSGQRWEDASRLGIKPGHKLGRVEPLFKKIEDTDIENFRKKYLEKTGNDPGKKGKYQGKTKKYPGKTKKYPEKTEKINGVGEEMDYVEFDDFKKLDIRIGRIKKVEDHPDADRLYVLTVDLGELGKRQLVAGIREFYDKKDLAGKDIVVVANLKPRKIKGIKSEGMLLAADDNRQPILLIPEKGTGAGTKIG